MGWIKRIPTHDCEGDLPSAIFEEVGSMYECDSCQQWWEVYKPKYVNNRWKKHGELDPD